MSAPITEVASAAQIAIPAVQLTVALVLFTNAVVPLVVKKLKRAKQPAAVPPPTDKLDSIDGIDPILTGANERRPSQSNR